MGAPAATERRSFSSFTSPRERLYKYYTAVSIASPGTARTEVLLVFVNVVFSAVSAGQQPGLDALRIAQQQRSGERLICQKKRLFFLSRHYL